MYDQSILQAGVVGHVWIFLAWEMFVVSWGFFATGFSFWVTKDGRLQKDSASIRWRLKVWFFILAVAIGFHIWHIIGLGFELHTCQSILCTDNEGVAWALIAGLAALGIIEVIELIRGATFHWHLYNVASYHPHIFNEQYTAKEPTKPMPSYQEEQEEQEYPTVHVPSAPSSSKLRFKLPPPFYYNSKRHGHGIKKNRSE